MNDLASPAMQYQPYWMPFTANRRFKGAPKLFARLPCHVTTLCFTIDGTFPNHEANPLIEENRRDITAEVVRQKADIGIAWDGDADRCFFIDGTGEFISGDFVTALLAEAFLLKEPGATIVYDLRASHAVKDVVGRYGGRALENRVGHAFIKRRMREGGLAALASFRPGRGRHLQHAAEQALQRALAQEHRTIPAQHHEGRPPPGRALSLFLAIGQHLR